MLKRIRYALWKRKARKAIREGLTAPCMSCDDPIVPGDFIGISHFRGSSEKKLIHSGYHVSMSQMDAFCETGAIGAAFWNGKEAVGIGESLGAKAIRTGKPQTM